MGTRRSREEEPENAGALGGAIEEAAPVAPPESVVGVMDWAWGQRATYGDETVLAFARTFGADSALPSQLAAALSAFVSRPV